MGFFSKKKIQATEGEQEQLVAESGILFHRTAENIPGMVNQYPTYSLQTAELYRKYNGQSEYGCAQVRTIIDTRTAFIAGEGIDINTENENFSMWAKKFLRSTKLNGSKFFQIVRATEMMGTLVVVLRPRPGDFPEVIKLPRTMKYKIINGVFYTGDGKDAQVFRDFVVFETSGDSSDGLDPVVKTGLCLTDCENYDRALRDIRRTNHTTSRITPTFKTESDEETRSLARSIAEKGWKIGQAFVGKAVFDYKTAGTGALDNLKTELASTAKNISATTGVPVHWLGWTDLMSNRATAEDLYQVINNSTLSERTIIAEALYDLLIKAQTVYIDNGGTELRGVEKDFTVKIPVIDYGRFETLVRALSVAYNDKIISADDYRSFIPGIDPITTKRRLEAEKEPELVIDNFDDDESMEAQA